jgi:thiamine-monophosphate kinase
LNEEDRLLAWLRRRAARTPAGDLLGDDAALLPAGGPWAATVDSQIAGVHHPAGLEPAAVARRLLAVNLSDLAAVGAEPAWALLALSAPAGFDHRRFFRALLAACDRHGVTLAGGDLARAEPAVATLTLLGRRPADGAWLRRADARAGHGVWVGGTLGESAAGRLLLAAGGGARFVDGKVELTEEVAARGGARAARRAVRRHLLPAPQLALGRALGRLALARPGDVGGVIDLSDGLATDLPRLCREGGVGAEVDLALLPFAPGFARLAAAIDQPSAALALGGGEDYVLLFTLAAGAEPPAGFDCRRIGTIGADRRLRVIDQGRRRPLPALGWDHLRK